MFHFHVCLNFRDCAEPNFSLLARPVSFPFKDVLGDCRRLSMFAQSFGLDLSSSKTQIRKDLKQLFHDPCPHKFRWCQSDMQQNRHPPTVSWGWSLMNLASTQWELCLLPYAGCCSMLRNVEANWGPRRRRLSRHSPCARHRHRCTTWAHNLCLESDRSDGETVHSRRSRERVQSGFSQCRGRRREERRERRELRNTQKWHGARMGWFWRHRIAQTSQCRCIGWICAKCGTQREHVRMRAYGEVWSAHAQEYLNKQFANQRMGQGRRTLALRVGQSRVYRESQPDDLCHCHWKEKERDERRQTEEEERAKKRETRERQRDTWKGEGRACHGSDGVSVQSWMCLCSRVCVSSKVSVCLLRFARDAPVYTFKTHPCVPSKRQCLTRHGRFDGTHGCKSVQCCLQCKNKEEHTTTRNINNNNTHSQRIEKIERRARHPRWEERKRVVKRERWEGRWEDRSKMRRQRWADREERKVKKINLQICICHSTLVSTATTTGCKLVVQFRDGVSRCFHHTIFGVSFLQYDTKNSRLYYSYRIEKSVLEVPPVWYWVSQVFWFPASWWGVVEICGSRLTLHVSWYFRCYLISSREEMIPKILGCWQEDGDGLSGAGKSSKNVLRITCKISSFFRQTRIAADHSSGTRNFPGLIGNVRHSRAACSLRIMKIFFFIQKVHVVQQVLNSEQKLIHGGGILFLLHGEFINSEMSDFIRLLTANSSLFIHFLAISCVRFLVDSVFRSEISKFFFFCELGQPTGLFDVAPMSVIQVVEWFHREPFQFFPNFFCNLFWAVRSPCKARSASFSMHSGRFFLSGRILSESCWDDDTLPKSRSFFPLKSDRSTFGEDSSLRYSFPELLTLDVCQRCITLDDAGFFSLPLATACWKNGDSEGICTSGSSVNSGEVNCLCSMVSVMSDATMVGTSLMSVVKLFFLETRFIGVYSLKISTRSLGS